MKVLAVAYVEDRHLVDEQILKQTIKPDRAYIVVDKNPVQGIENRRKRIAENQTRLQEIVKQYPDYDLIWQLEGDGVIPNDTLERLLADYEKVKNDNFGYITANEIGRHGLYHVGAWVNFTDDSFESIDHTLTGLQPIEASGFYCLLASREAFLKGRASWNDEPYGPDVVWGLSMNYKKYIDMNIGIGHKSKRGIIHPSNISTTTVIFKKINGIWKYKIKE